MLGILAVGATLIIGDLLERHHIHILPEAAVGVLIGALCAAMTSYLDDDAMLDDERFNFYVFTDYLLPPISALPRHPPVARRMCLATERSSLCVCTVFEAGYNMQSRPFFANLGPTCFFAFVGTFTSAVVVGGLVYVAGQLGLCYPLGGLASLTFGRRHCLHPYHRHLPPPAATPPTTACPTTTTLCSSSQSLTAPSASQPHLGDRPGDGARCLQELGRAARPPPPPAPPPPPPPPPA